MFQQPHRPAWSPPIYSTAQVISHGIKTVVYGRAGTGKTRLCATCPSPFVISAESGLLSLQQWNIPYTPIYSIQDFQAVTAWVLGSAEVRQFATICIDSGSEIAEQILTYEKTRNKDPRKAYGEVIDQFIAELRKYRDIDGPNVYMAFKQETDKNGFSRPLMPGQQLPMQLPYFPDEVFQLVAGKDANGQTFRALRTQPDFNNEAKDRSGKLAEWEPADLGYIFRKIAA